MNTTIQAKMQVRGKSGRNTLGICIGMGGIAGLIGTLVMDLLLMMVLSILGLQPFSCFSIVGDTVASLFSSTGVDVMGGVPMGVLTHYVVGPVVGGLYGFIVSLARSSRTNSLKKDILLAVLYVEILSQPMLAMTPFLLKFSLSDTLQWYGGSFVMHFIWGVVLGWIFHKSLRRD